MESPIKKEVIIGGISIYGVEPKHASIYGIRAVDGCVFVYIGSTTRTMKSRVLGHKHSAAKGSKLPIHEWMRSQQMAFDVVLIETVPESERYAREKHWISTTPNLLNMTDGGPGASGVKWAGTERAMKMAQKIRTGGFFHCLKCNQKFWRKRNEITKGDTKYCSRVCSNARHKEIA